MNAEVPKMAARPEGLRGPTAVVDERRAKKNIQRMKARMDRAGVYLRPHFKTHQCIEIARWFSGEGIEAAAVSSVDMAAHFAAAGFEDITIALPVDLCRVDEIERLSKDIRLGLLFDNLFACEVAGRTLKRRCRAWIEIDTGQGRTGVPWNRTDAIQELADRIEKSPTFDLAGVLTHAGHSYSARGRAEILKVHAQSLERMAAARAAVERTIHRTCLVSIGDTPTCCVAEDFPGVDEARPGNFVFCDAMQLHIGSCEDEEIAFALLCPVIGVYPERGLIAIHGGAVHLSKDSVARGGEAIFGYLAHADDNGLGAVDRRARVTSLSQEHGLVTLAPELVSSYGVGDVVAVVPAHSCLAADLHRRYLLLPSGKTAATRRGSFPRHRPGQDVADARQELEAGQGQAGAGDSEDG